MPIPRVTLGGVPIVLHAGAPEQADAPVLAEAIVRMGQGGGVKLTHFKKAGGSVSGQGCMPPGLDGLDYSQPLLLRLTKQESITGPGTMFTLSSTPRADVPPWGLALVGNEWVRRPVAMDGLLATVTALPGATLYSVQWMPEYWVFVSQPPKQLSPADGMHSWSFPWEEV